MVGKKNKLKMIVAISQMIRGTIATHRASCNNGRKDNESKL